MKSFAELLDNINAKGCKQCKHFLKDCSDSINENCLQCVSNTMNFEPKQKGSL